jgi:hypothetical protein
VVEQRLAGLAAEQVHRVVEQMDGADAVGNGVVIAEDDGGVDLAVPQHRQRHLRMRVDRAQLDAGVVAAHRRRRVGHQRAERRLEPRQPDPSGPQAHQRGQLRAGRIHAADDLGGAAREQLTVRGEPDAPPHPLDEPGAGLGLEAGEVMADRRLRVVQVLRGLGDRAVGGDRREHSKPPTLTDLTAAVRSAVRAHTDWARTAQLVADALRRHLPGPEVLTAAQRLGDPDRPTGHLLHADPDGTFSVPGLVWRPGQTTRIHDHITWCVVGVLQGIEHEDLYDEQLNLIGENDNRPGTAGSAAALAATTTSG